MALPGHSPAPNGRPPPHPAPQRSSQTPPSGRRELGDALNVIQEEYARVLAERDALRSEIVRAQSTADEQEAELTLMRRSFWDLQAQLERTRQRYQEERRQLHEELKHERAVAGLSPPSPLGELHTPLVSPVSSSSAHTVIQISGDTSRREQEPSSRDRKMKGRARNHSDAERNNDYREPKRVRSSDGSRAAPTPVPYPGPVFPPHPPHTGSSHRSTPSTCNRPDTQPTQPAPSQSTSKTAAPPMSDELTLNNVPPEFRKDAAGWSVSFNPKFPRNMDVNMIRSIPHPSVVCSIHFSSDGRYVATGCNQAAYIYDTNTGAQICALIDRSVQLPTDADLYIRSVRFSPDGAFLTTGAEDKKVRVWNIKQRTLRHTFLGHTEEIYALDCAGDGNWVVSGSADRTARVWDLKGTNNHKILKVDASVKDSGVTSISISPNNRFVAGGCLDQTIRVWDIETGHLVAKMRGHTDSVYSVKFAPDGRTLVSGSLDYTVKYWDMSGLVPRDTQSVLVTCPMVGDVKGHQDYVLTVACSSDSRWFASGAKDRCLMFWDPQEGLARFKLAGHTNSVISIDMHGPYIATASGDMYCRIWAYSINN